MLQKCTILVEDHGEIKVLPGPLFLDVLNADEIDLHNDCGGYGKCGKCRIQFKTEPPECLPGDLRHLSEAERADGMRLACFHQVRGDCTLVIPPIKRTGDLEDELLGEF